LDSRPWTDPLEVGKSFEGGSGVGGGLDP
jgi:hypothetical protein